MVCAPKVGTTPECIMGDATLSCPGTYPTSTAWNTSYSDGRQCSSCNGCSWPYASNAHCYVNMSATSNCSPGTSYPMLEGQNICMTGWISASVVGTCSAGTSALVGNVSGSGMARVVCCK
jgi:hypothetical protein